MEGKIRDRNGKLYVLYSTTEDSQPIRHFLWWRIVETHGNSYSGARPDDGDVATYAHSGRWTTRRDGGGSTGVVITGDGTTQAELVEKVGVEPPATRGKDLRWHHGQWERLLVRGWVPAGEGDRRPTKRRREKVTQP